MNCSGRRKKGASNWYKASNSLVTRLDGLAYQDAGLAWHAEIKRRLAEIDAGTAQLIEREEFRRRMRERMRRI